MPLQMTSFRTIPAFKSSLHGSEGVAIRCFSGFIQQSILYAMEIVHVVC